MRTKEHLLNNADKLRGHTIEQDYAYHRAGLDVYKLLGVADMVEVCREYLYDLNYQFHPKLNRLQYCKYFLLILYWQLK